MTPRVEDLVFVLVSFLHDSLARLGDVSSELVSPDVDVIFLVKFGGAEVTVRTVALEHHLGRWEGVES